MSLNKRVLWTGGYGVLLLVILAAITFISGYWAILLTLSPAVFLLVLDAHRSEHAPKIILISYITAFIAGWVTYTALAQGISPMAVNAKSAAALRVIGSALIAFVITTGIFYWLNISQPMVYIAVFAAAIGLFPTVQSLATAIFTVFLISGIQVVRRRYGPDFNTTIGRPLE